MSKAVVLRANPNPPQAAPAPRAASNFPSGQRDGNTQTQGRLQSVRAISPEGYATVFSATLPGAVA